MVSLQLIDDNITTQCLLDQLLYLLTDDLHSLWQWLPLYYFPYQDMRVLIIHMIISQPLY